MPSSCSCVTRNAQLPFGTPATFFGSSSVSKPSSRSCSRSMKLRLPANAEMLAYGELYASVGVKW